MRRVLIMLLIIACLNMVIIAIASPQVGTWVKKADMPTARYGIGVAVVDGKIYVIGGVDTWPNPNGLPDTVLSTVEVFDTGFSVSPQDRLATVWGKVK